MHLFGDADEGVLAAGHEALAALAARLDEADRRADPKAPTVSCGLHVAAALDEVRALAAAAPSGGVPGFNRPKGLAPVLPFFLQALMHGATPEAREQGAEGLGELAQCTSEAALKPMAVQM